MTWWLVWDEINAEKEDARSIQARLPLQAAVAYAEQDSDGYTDGLYHECPQPIVVEDRIVGTRYRFDVSAEMEPRFVAVQLSPKPQEAVEE